MGAAKFEITRKCKICGEPFVAKTITSWYCSPKCSKVAFKRRKDEEKRNERLDAIALSVATLVVNEDGDWEFEAVGVGHVGGLETLIDIYAS